MHTGEKPFKCHLCDRGYRQKRELKSHLKRSHGCETEEPEKKKQQNVHECSECHKLFTRADSLAIHMRLHTGDLKHKCNVCEKAYATKSALVVHQRSHEAAVKKYRCPVCDLELSGSQARKSHLRLHSKEKPFRCHICSKDFARVDDLQIHLRVKHDSVYRCQKCRKLFTSYADLKDHEVKHPGSGPTHISRSSFQYSCRACPETFQTREDRIQHELTHEGPLLCKFCDKTFVSSDSKQEHAKMHEVKKVKKPACNYKKCVVCCKTFSGRASLGAFRLDEDFVCAECEKKNMQH